MKSDEKKLEKKKKVKKKVKKQLFFLHGKHGRVFST